MSTDMQKTDAVLSTILEKALDGAQATGDFIAGQIPDVVKELLAYYTATDIFWILISILGFFGTWALYRWAIRMYEIDSDYGPMYILPACSGILSIIIFMVNILDLLKIMVAPKLYLLEYAANLVHPK